MLLKQDEIVNLLGTIFGGVLLHIWCSGEYFQQFTKTMPEPPFIHLTEYVNINFRSDFKIFKFIIIISVV